MSRHAIGTGPADSLIEREERRISARRQRLALEAPDVNGIGRAGLAISGGGIRSATFGLGVLQALAKAPVHPTSGPSSVPDDPGADPPCVLREFDYLSTVSGGGYIGAFFCSLFIPGRLRPVSGPPADSDIEAARQAYEVLRYEPPGRMRSSTNYQDEPIGAAPLAWLRENGRYLTPTGGGDLLYAIALAIRNWFGMQYVLGAMLLLFFSLLALGRNSLAKHWIPYRSVEDALLGYADASGSVGVWWSTLVIVVAALCLLWLIPSCTAFWLSYPERGGSERDRPRWFSSPAVAALAIAAVTFGIGAAWRLLFPHWAASQYLTAVVCAEALLGFAFHGATIIAITHKGTIADHRVWTTRNLAFGLQTTIAVAALALADTLGQSLYLVAQTAQTRAWWHPLTPAAALGALVWIVRKLALVFDEKARPSWLAKTPASVIAGLAGGTLALLVATVWALVVQWFRWRGVAPNVRGLEHEAGLIILAGLTLLAAVLAWTSGQFTGFINLSTLQALYGARLTRAYLGASNGARFAGDGAALRSVADAVPGDQLPLDRYYARDVLAPLHVINITVNQTIDPAEQLVQRDRKGKPLAVLPDGFVIDGWYLPNSAHDVAAPKRPARGTRQTLMLGQWVGASGAAFTTGLGRTTSLGLSLALGLANVRLGTWWCSGEGHDPKRPIAGAFKNLFPTQTYLLYELLARFYGLRRELQYLSDGGHFENTAVYELLRPERKLRLIVVCDDGCDPGFGFGDLANLIRLVRIDFQIEVEVDAAIAEDRVLGQVFGVPTDFAPGSTHANKCALLFNVYPPLCRDRTQGPACRLVVLKPALIASAPHDVQQYGQTHRDFPQQSTANQFFDEAQWESYRQLGYTVGTRVFGGDEHGGIGVGAALWNYLRTHRGDRATR